MIADAKEVLKFKSLPLSLWSHAIHHAAWIKNHTFIQSIDSKITLYQAYFGKHQSLYTLCLFGCKAYAHMLIVAAVQHHSNVRFPIVGRILFCCMAHLHRGVLICRILWIGWGYIL